LAKDTDHKKDKPRVPKKKQKPEPDQKTPGLKESVPPMMETHPERGEVDASDEIQKKEDTGNAIKEKELKEKEFEEEIVVGPEGKPRAEVSANLIGELYFGTAEKTFDESSYHPKSMYKPYNSDDLFQKTGDYSIYEDMLHDDQVSVCMQIKKDLVIGSGYDIVTEVNDDQHTAIKKDLELALNEDPETPFDDMLEEVISSYDFGFSLSEKLFKTRPDGTLSLGAIKTRHPSTWLIHTDKHGNIEKYEQRGRTETISVAPKSLIHYVNSRKFQNPYGTSDLRTAYSAWFIKRQIVRFYGMFLEKAASPTPVARYDKNAPKQAIDAIYNAIKKFQAKTALTIPKDIEIEFLESKSEGQVFTRGVNIFNMFIGRSLLIPDLLGFQGEETSGGSHSLGKHQMEVLFKHIQRRRVTLERIVNKHIIWPLVVYNHGFVEHYPKFKLRPISDESLIELTKLWIEAMKGHLYEPSEEEINHFRKIAKFPEGAVKFPIPAPLPGQPGQPVPPVEGTPDPEVEEEEVIVEPGSEDVDAEEQLEEELNNKEGYDEKDTEKQSQEDDKSVPQSRAKGSAPAKKRNPAPIPKPYKRLYNLPVGDYHKKVNFKGIESHLDSFKDAVTLESEPVVKRIFEDLFDQIEQKKIVKDQKPERIETIRLKYLKDIKLIFKRNLREAFVISKQMAQQEIMKGAYRTPLPDDKFLEFLEQETFQFVGDWSYNVTKRSRLAMIEAIKDGKPLSAVLDLLDDQGMTEAMASIERFSRTKFTDVTNRGRLEFFNESGIVSAYQYAAVLDDRTSPICDGLHGKIFKMGTEPIPPLHFNCRSLLVPITKYEEFTVDGKVGSKNIDQFIDENKGDGFSKR
jgi:SPP1 gp7 family putative phage head morphogenesis protein